MSKAVVDGTAPVSYTHLDVYKRQVQACITKPERLNSWTTST